MAERGVTLKRAGEILGGDRPLSVRTVSAMITRGDLEAYGERKTRRVTIRSIESYQRGVPWRDARSQSHASAGSAEPDTPDKRRTGHGRRFSQSTLPDNTPGADFAPARLPKIGVIRS